MNVCLGRGGEAWVGFRSLRWPTCAVVGCCGPSWACVGLPWAAVGLRWPFFAVVGLCVPALAFGAVLWACVGLHWPSLGAVGLRRPALAFRGLSWLSSKPKRGVVGLVQPASDKDLIKRPPQLAVYAMGWACSCIKLSSSSVRKTIEK